MADWGQQQIEQQVKELQATTAHTITAYCGVQQLRQQVHTVPAVNVYVQCTRTMQQRVTAAAYMHT
jgi:hypothetical protein